MIPRRYNYAALQHTSGRTEDAVANYQRVLAIDPGHPAALVNMATILQA